MSAERLGDMSSPHQASNSAIQMLTDNKVANHGKQVSSDGRSQIPGVQQQQGAAALQSSKGGLPGIHGAKSSQVSHGNPGPKASGQSGSGGMLKTKSKRERSISIDSGESRSAAPTPALEPDAKGGRLCKMNLVGT
ncbi:hypothetical protein XENOCAPTIV_006337 [Xenoophorus captivus]|uniref:Uncharacterized protein n=1 Tax=Xenoophorus captivus TaxID=1517983 RepID=A0ABV0S9V7_9TELE